MLRHNRKRILLFTGLLLALPIFAACQDDRPTEYLLEITREVTRIVVVTATPGDGTPVAQAPPDGETPATQAPPATATTTPPPPDTDATPPAFPTPTIGRIVVAEQDFERGRAFWVEPLDPPEIWVIDYADESRTHGEWTRYADTWDDSMPAFDPDIEAPEGLFQPERGFGKLWRENDAVREALGWATGAEAGNVITYTYFPRGEFNEQGDFIEAPGYHVLETNAGISYIFDEMDNTWRVDDN